MTLKNNFGSWEYLPVAVLEDIYLRLPYRNRLYAALTCKRWCRVFYSKRLWANFVFRDKSFCWRRLTVRDGHRLIEYNLNYNGLHSCLRSIAFAVQRISVEPMSDYHALYEFMTILSNMFEFARSPNKDLKANPLMPLMHSFLFTFACRTSGDRGNRTNVLIGTGGRLYQGLLRLLSDLPPLHSLGLRNLRLERHDALQLLLPVVGSVGECLHCLELVNCAAVPATTMWDVLSFSVLNHLVLSAQHVTEQFLQALLPSNGQFPCPKLYFMTVSFDDITMIDIEPLLSDGVHPERLDSFASLATEPTWRCLAEQRPSLSICIELRPRLRHFPAALQPCVLAGAKVVHISIAAARLRFTAVSMPGAERPLLRRLQAFDDDELSDNFFIEPLLPRIVKLHYTHLESVVQPGLPRVHGPRDFASRCDAALVAAGIYCRRLRIMVIRERVSTMALLLFLEFASSSFCSLFVRRNALLRRSTFPLNGLLAALSECKPSHVDVNAKNYTIESTFYGSPPPIPTRQQLAAAKRRLAPIGKSIDLTEKWIANRLRFTHCDFQFLSDKAFCSLSPKLANMHGSTFAYS